MGLGAASGEAWSLHGEEGIGRCTPVWDLAIQNLGFRV